MRAEHGVAPDGGSVVAEDLDHEAATREWRASSRLSGQSVAARSVGVRTLAESAPARHAAYVASFGELLEQTIKARAYRIERPVTAALAAMGQELASIGADPRDCVLIQTDVLHKIGELGLEDPAADVIREESALLLIELMGYLARAYRRMAVGVAGH